MSTALRNITADATQRRQVVEDCTRLIDAEVAAKSGLGGMAVKGAYAVVKKIKPGFIEEVIDRLLDPFVARLEPFYADFVRDGAGDLEAYFGQRAADIATALLAFTDERAQRTDNRTLKKAYDTLRPAGKKHVEAAIPGIARLIAKHTASQHAA